MNIYLISDNLTRDALNNENVAVHNSWWSLRADSGSILLVESAWQGYKNRWKYQIANYPDHPKRSNHKLLHLVQAAKDKGIPTVFWNKEDGVHFHRFIDSAKHFDHILTVDETCVARYREVVPASTTVDVAMFPVQPRLHNYQGFRFRHLAANFVGSFSQHIHDVRRERQIMLFQAALNAGLPIHVFDRNSDRKNQQYRYPAEEFHLQVFPKLAYAQTADVYRDYLVSLNVNTVENSPTMFSRRVVEVLACGGILVSTPSMAMDKLFRDFCHIVHDVDETTELFARLKHGASKDDLERAKAGADFVLNHFTWQNFLQQIQQIAFK